MSTGRLYAWSRAHPSAIDATLAATVFVVFGLPGALLTGWQGLLIGVLTAAPLAVRRRWPAGVLAWTVGVSLLQLVLLERPLLVNVVQPIVVYSVAVHGRSHRVRVAALVAGLSGAVLGPWRWLHGSGVPADIIVSTVVLAVFVVVLWLLGGMVRAREGTVGTLRTANEALARDREQRDQLVAQQERLAVARDIHDVVAHSLSVVVVQADGAAYAAEHGDHWSRDEAVAALATIGDTARSALAETRRVVGVLRDDSTRASPAAPEGSAPGLDQITDLVESVRAAGVPVTATVEYDAQPPVSAAVQLAAYRVVQEGLTNILKHAGAKANGQVLVEQLPGVLRVTVADDGGPADPAATRRHSATLLNPGPGSGLIGMRERVAAAGGMLVAGPRARGGYAVTATLPLDAVPAEVQS